MIPKIIASRLDGYRGRLRQEYSMWDYRRCACRDLRRFENWIGKLHLDPPDVFLGSDLPYGGVRGHVRSIKDYSSLRVQMVPDEMAMGGLDRFTTGIRERFMEFDPSGTPTVHSHVIPWMIRWCRRQQERGLRWIHTYHLPYFPEHGNRGLRPDQIEINDALVHEACYADVRLSVSRWQQDYLRKEHGIKTDYLPNGVDVVACDRSSATRFRKRTKIRDPFLLYVGRNDPVKNPADFVRMARELPGHVCVMIGQNLSGESLLRDWEIEAPPNLHVLGGVPYPAVQDAIAACTALVVTSKREGLPTLVLEGMTHAKPVVVPDEEGCLEAVGSGEFGEVYRQDKLSHLVEQALHGFHKGSKGQAARQRVLAEYDWRVVAPKLDELYRGGKLS